MGTVATATAIGLAVDIVRVPVYFATEFYKIAKSWPVVLVGVIGVMFGTLIEWF